MLFVPFGQAIYTKYQGNIIGEVEVLVITQEMRTDFTHRSRPDNLLFKLLKS